MAQTPSIFDRLRSMQTEGLPLHTLIVEACEVGNALIAACEAADDFIVNELASDMPTMDYCQANPAAGEVLLAVRAAITAAHPSNGDTPTNGARAA